MPPLAAERMRGELLSRRAFDASPFSPAWTGLLVALSVGLVYVAHAYGAAWLFGWTPQRAPLWLELLFAAAIGYAPTLVAYSVRGTRRDAEELRPGLLISEAELHDWLRAVAAFPRPGRRVWCAGWAALGAASALLGMVGVGPSEPVLAIGIGRQADDPLLAWAVLRNALLLYVVAEACWVDVALASRLGALGRESVRVDLLDLAPLRPFARRAVRSMLLWIPLVALSNMLLIFPLVAVYRALRGAQRRIGEVKRRVLEETRSAIRARSGAVLGAAEAGPPEDGRLADLIAYEARIARVLTVPLDVPSVLRLILFGTLGVLSWLART